MPIACWTHNAVVDVVDDLSVHHRGGGLAAVQVVGLAAAGFQQQGGNRTDIGNAG